MPVTMRAIKMMNIEAPIVLKIAAEKFPQAIVGKIWRYLSDRTPNGDAGRFQTDVDKIELGAPAALDGKLFLVEGVVLHQNDNPPTSYEVMVTVQQGNFILHQEVPQEQGSGRISNQDMTFQYRFTLVK